MSQFGDFLSYSAKLRSLVKDYREEIGFRAAPPLPLLLSMLAAIEKGGDRTRRPTDRRRSLARSPARDRPALSFVRT